MHHIVSGHGILSTWNRTPPITSMHYHTSLSETSTLFVAKRGAGRNAAWVSPDQRRHYPSILQRPPTKRPSPFLPQPLSRSISQLPPPPLVESIFGKSTTDLIALKPLENVCQRSAAVYNMSLPRTEPRSTPHTNQQQLSTTSTTSLLPPSLDQKCIPTGPAATSNRGISKPAPSVSNQASHPRAISTVPHAWLRSSPLLHLRHPLRRSSASPTAPNAASSPTHHDPHHSPQNIPWDPPSPRVPPPRPYEFGARMFVVFPRCPEPALRHPLVDGA